MDAFAYILFGATGDHAKLKIWPGIYKLYQKGLIPETGAYIGSGRTKHSHESFRQYLKKVITQKYQAKTDEKALEKMLARTFYFPGDILDEDYYNALKDHLDKLVKDGMECHNRILHLAIAPQFYEQVIRSIGQSELHHPQYGWQRLLIEKPFGNSLKTARSLDNELKKHFRESEIYRIDHYLSKEPVQNMLAFRFANGIYEPLLNKDYVDHIQIQGIEDFGIKDRAAYYDQTGELRDMIQSHHLQLLSTITMNAPTDLRADTVRDQRRQLIKSIDPITGQNVHKQVVRGQYQGYLTEPNVIPNSKTETFVSLKLTINSDRWRGVPVYIRQGKKIGSTKTTEASIIFKGKTHPSPNVLTFRIYPNEGINWRFLVKKPGPSWEMQSEAMQFCYKDVKDEQMTEYEKLIHDALAGDQMLFPTASGVEAQWQFIDPIIQEWQVDTSDLEIYQPGSFGPNKMHELISQSGDTWLDPSLDICPI